MNRLIENTTGLKHHANSGKGMLLPFRKGFLVLWFFFFSVIIIQAQTLSTSFAGAFTKAHNFHKLFAACTSVNSGPWNNAATWDCGHVPGSSDDVVISNGHTVTVDITNATCANITIDGTLNFNSGTGLDVTGNWVNNGILGAGTGTVTFSGPY